MGVVKRLDGSRFRVMSVAAATLVVVVLGAFGGLSISGGDESPRTLTTR